MKHSDLPIRYYDHPDLRKKAAKVEALTPEVLEICEAMVKKMKSLDNCIGFAGPQLGISLRIFVIREEKWDAQNRSYFDQPEVIINPVLSKPSKETDVMLEGCMSLPNLYVEVERPISIHVSYQNMKGEVIQEHLKDFRARMFMHENDHLNGVLHIDRMPPAKRKKIEDDLRALKKRYADL